MENSEPLIEHLHPIIVHFPIVLLVVAGVCYLILLFNKAQNLDRFAFFLHLGGLAACLAAIFSGDWAESQLVQTVEIHELIEEHEFLGMMTAWAFGLLAVWAFLRQKSKIKLERIAFVVLFMAGLGLMLAAAHHGGELVYDQGAGVEPMEEILIQKRNLEQHQSDPQP